VGDFEMVISIEIGIIYAEAMALILLCVRGKVGSPQVFRTESNDGTEDV